MVALGRDFVVRACLTCRERHGLDPPSPSPSPGVPWGADTRAVSGGQRRGGPPGGQYIASFQLAAVGSAASVARAFVRQRLTDLKLPGLIEDSTLVMSELVTNAVRATGLAEPGVRLHDIEDDHLIEVQLRVIDASLYVEVWDRSLHAPVKQNADDDAENGRGLVLVEALTRRWGIYRPAAGGKIVWGELSLGELTFCPTTMHVQPCHFPCALCPAKGRQ